MKSKIIIFTLLGSLALLGFQFASNIGLHLLQSPGYQIANYQAPDYGLGDNHVDKLMPFPDLGKGERSPFDLYKYGG